jgi:hypothetical protein
MPQRSPIARNPSSASRISASAAAGACPKFSRIWADIILATARSHGSGSANRPATRSAAELSQAPCRKTPASGPISRSAGWAPRIEPLSRSASWNQAVTSSSGALPSSPLRAAKACASALSSTSASPGSASTSRASVSPSARCPLSHQYHPSRATSATATGLSPASIAARIAACRLSCSASSRRSQVSCSPPRRCGSASAASRTRYAACARRISSASPASASR